MCNQSKNITEADVFKEFERQGNSVKEYAKNETTIPCNKEWLRTIRRLLSKEHLRGIPQVANALEITDALLEYADGNFEYETEDDMLYPTIENMRRVIRSSYAKRIKRSMTNQRNASQKGKKDDSQEYDPESEDDNTTDSNRKQSQAIADYNRNIEKETIEIEKETIEKESKERKKYKPTTTTNNSSSGKFSLFVSKAIEILERYNVKNCDFALKVLENDREETGLTSQEESLAIVLYLLTGKTKSNISRITNLMDEAVSKGAREHDIWSEVFNLALRASGQERDFKDKEQCRIMTGSIVNRLREIVKQSEAAQEQRPVEETQPSLATPQQQEAEQPQQVVEQPQQETEQPQQVTEQPQQAAEQPKPLRLAVVPQAKFSVGQQSQLSLSVPETIDFITHNGCKTYRKAFTAIKEHGGNIDVQKTVVALYFLTGKSQPEVLEITGLVDKVVNEEAGKEEDICKEVFKMATDTKDSNDCNFDDRNGCRAAIDRIKNYLNGLLFEKYLKGPNKPF